MKRWVRILIGVGVVAILVGAYFIVQDIQDRQREEQFEQARAEQIELLRLDPLNVDRIVLGGPDRELVILRDGESFELQLPYELNLTQGAVQRIVQAAARISARREIEADPQDLEQYGLGESAQTAEVHLSSGEARTIRVGSQSPTGSGYYAQVDNDGAVYLISGFTGSALTATLDSLRDRSFPQINKQNVARVTLATPARTIRIVPVEEREGGILTSFTTHIMTDPFIRDRSVATDRLQTLLEEIPEFRISRFVADRPEGLVQYGLDSPNRELYLADSDGNELHLLFGNETEEGEVYAKRPDMPTVFTIDASLDFFDDWSAFELTDKFVLIVNIANVTNFTVETGEVTYEGRIERTEVEGEEEPRETYYFEGEEVEEEPFKQFYQEVIGITADAARPDPVSGNPAPEDVALHIGYDLTGVNTDRIAADFVEYDTDFYAVFREGVSEMLVSKLRVERMLEAAARFAETGSPERDSS